MFQGVVFCDMYMHVNIGTQYEKYEINIRITNPNICEQTLTRKPIEIIHVIVIYSDQQLSKTKTPLPR
jgi:hypothetical protein